MYAGNIAAPRGDPCRRRIGPHPPRGRQSLNLTNHLDNAEAVDVDWHGRSAVAFDKCTAGVNSPGDLCNFSPNQFGIVIEGSAPDRNVGLAFGKIERPLLHDQLDRDAWMPRMKAIKEAGFDDALRPSRGSSV